MNYIIRTISVAKPGQIIEEYYAGNCRKSASRELHNLQRMGVNKIEMVDVPNNSIYEYINKNNFNEYKINKKPIK